MTGPVPTGALVAALNRELIELADGVTPEEVMRLALDGIDIAYRAHGEHARVSLLAVQADWIMQHLARTEAWAKDEQAKRHAAEDKLVEARSRSATAEAAHQQVTAERDAKADVLAEMKLCAEASAVEREGLLAELARLRAEGEAKDRALKAKAEEQVAYWRKRQEVEKSPEDGISEDGETYTPIGDVDGDPIRSLEIYRETMKVVVSENLMNERMVSARVGGSYQMPDGREFWIDEPVAQEIARRALGVSPSSNDRLGKGPSSGQGGR